MYKLESEKYKSFESKRYEIEKIRHDFKNQLLTIKEMLGSGEYVKSEAFIDELEKSIAKTKIEVYSKIPVINAIISSKTEICTENGIKTSVDISINEAGGIDQNHLCSVFSNTIDNAINANLKITERDKRYIEIKARQDSGYIVACVKNPVCENQAPTENKSSAEHGYGLRILEDIAKKYDGAFKIEFSEDTCKAEIMLKAEAENG